MKKEKIVKAVMFLLGAAFGAAVSAFVTDKVVEKKYWDACDKELNEASLKYREEKKHLEDEIINLNAEISRQNVAIAVLNEKLVKAGIPVEEAKKEPSDESEDDRSDYISGQREHEVEPEEAKTYTAYRTAYSATEYDEEVTVEEVEANDQAVKNVGPYLIDLEQYETENVPDYPKLEWKYYIWDGKVLDEDNEWIDNYASFIGEAWLEGHHKSGDKMYVRNDYYGNDYEIEFIAGYGEQNMSISGGWEDD